MCGVLIEIEDGRLFIGVGCNVRTAPQVSALGQNGGRPATCLADHNEQIRATIQNLDTGGAAVVSGLSGDCDADVDIPSSSNELQDGDFHKELAVDVCQAVSDWVEAQSDSADRVLLDFEECMDRSPQRLRDANNNAVADGEEVLPVRLNDDGTLLVSVLCCVNDTIYDTNTPGERRFWIAENLGCRLLVVNTNNQLTQYQCIHVIGENNMGTWFIKGSFLIASRLLAIIQ